LSRNVSWILSIVQECFLNPLDCPGMFRAPSWLLRNVFKHLLNWQGMFSRKYWNVHELLAYVYSSVEIFCHIHGVDQPGLSHDHGFKFSKISDRKYEIIRASSAAWIRLSSNYVDAYMLEDMASRQLDNFRYRWDVRNRQKHVRSTVACCRRSLLSCGHTRDNAWATESMLDKLPGQLEACWTSCLDSWKSCLDSWKHAGKVAWTDGSMLDKLPWQLEAWWTSCLDNWLDKFCRLLEKIPTLLD
jgi:hypothetical protein